MDKYLFAVLLVFVGIMTSSVSLAYGQGSIGDMEIVEITESSQNENDDSNEYIELIRNGDFEAGLEHWTARPNEINCRDEIIGESCTKQETGGFPKSSVTDKLSPEERYFVTYIPSYSFEGLLGWIGKAVSSSLLEQDIDIPTSKSVILSFKARGYSDTVLEIFVKDRDTGDKIQINQLVLNEKRNSFGDFINREYDMTSFAGKKVTLMFVSKQISIPGMGYENLDTAVYLDDISLIAQVPVVPSSSFETNESFWLVMLLPVIGSLIIAISIVFRKKRTYTITEKEELTKETQTGLDQKYSQDQREDEYTIKTGEEFSEEKLQQKNKMVEESFEEKDEFERKVNLDNNLKCLWYLYKIPSHSITTVGEAAIRIYQLQKRSGSTERKVSLSMGELEKNGLVEIIPEKQYEGHTLKSRDVFKATDLGMQLMEKARKEKVTSWENFQEKYLE